MRNFITDWFEYPNKLKILWRDEENKLNSISIDLNDKFKAAKTISDFVEDINEKFQDRRT